MGHRFIIILTFVKIIILYSDLAVPLDVELKVNVYKTRAHSGGCVGNSEQKKNAIKQILLNKNMLQSMVTSRHDTILQDVKPIQKTLT